MLKIIQPSLAEAGKIKIGRLGAERTSRRGDPYRLPEKLDHFLITSTRRSPAGDLEVDSSLMEALAPEYADEDGRIRRIPIVVHSDDIDEVFPTTLAMYVGRKLACRGDGEEATRYQIQQGRRTGASKQCSCPCPYFGADTEPKCKAHGVLNCSILAPGRGVAGSVYKWRTTSEISLNRMVASLQQIRALTGSLMGLPLLLCIEPILVETGTVYCCHVELRESIVEAQNRLIGLYEARHRVTAMASPVRLSIPAPAGESESDEEQADVSDEFHPDGGSEAIDVDFDETPNEQPNEQPKPTPKEPRNKRLRTSSLDEEDFDV